jgi:hypothetical protein
MRITISFLKVLLAALLLVSGPLAASGADLTPAQTAFWKVFKEAIDSNKPGKLVPAACFEGLARGEARMAIEVYLRQVVEGALSQVDPVYSFRKVDSDMQELLATLAKRGVFPTLEPTQVFWIESKRGGPPTRVLLGEKEGRLLVVCFTPEGVRARTYREEYRHREGLDPLPRGVKSY